ncbi:hypothetical protein BKH46_05840 [Helicobacter sp. 12S02634-8]|uniref:hypothetical protein n=1 Tax=Helicobacter sp. 12S02634-8 TaxID=1476199 RepID=UPI000BA74A58|nr:hypothetical protein [Helicobacter sp. 12S02634-8]PAF46957.1 hypothetical protein BKH46_05840 [Helicobacter sp. 12S02634-8]
MKIPFLNPSSNSHLEGAILIVSQSLENIERICSQLSLQGLSVFKRLQKNPLEVSPEDLTSKLQAVILDIQQIENSYDYCALIPKIFPKDIPCIILSRNDSIKICQQFLSQGIFYLDWESQIDQIYEKIFNFEVNIPNKKSVKITCLGTKGGVGNSFVTYGLAQVIKQRFLSLVLNVQGADSSFNLDFIAGKSFEKELDIPDGVCLFKEQAEDAYDYHHPKHKRFNFILYDHSVQSHSKDTIEMILNESDTIVLVMNSELDSLRKTKEILRINEFLRSVHQGAKKVFVCCNQARLGAKSSLDIADMEEIMGAKIDICIPNQSLDRSCVGLVTKGNTKKSLELLADKLTGVPAKRKRRWI